MRVYLRTFGCRANQYDSERVRALVERTGGEIVDDVTLADAAVFNSCAVTAEAEVDLRKSIRRAARQKASLHTVVMGCAAALDKGTLGTLPTVGQVVPGDDLVGVASALGLPLAPSDVPFLQSGTRALLRIQDGCDEHCTFCATTLARGKNRSRTPDALVVEARDLALRHPEIVLTGVHIGTYGRDIGTTLGALVARLLREVAGVRIRLSSVEATEVDPGLASLFEPGSQLAPHLHAPLQSGSDAVLKRMGRHWYSASRYASAVEGIVRARAVFGLGADVIAGFPGETEGDHRATIALLRALPVTYLHVFPYSLRPGTAASRLGGQLPAEVVRRRAQELRALGEELGLEYGARRLGGEADVVVVRGDRREGLTEDFLSVWLADTGLPRGTRLRTRLSGMPSQLLAVPVATTFHA
jgi:threonylcarbamoyladenosine tRNA methylthiotransferase MtaB